MNYRAAIILPGHYVEVQTGGIRARDYNWFRSLEPGRGRQDLWIPVDPIYYPSRRERVVLFEG